MNPSSKPQPSQRRWIKTSKSLLNLKHVALIKYAPDNDDKNKIYIQFAHQMHDGPEKHWSRYSLAAQESGAWRRCTAILDGSVSDPDFIVTSDGVAFNLEHIAMMEFQDDAKTEIIVTFSTMQPLSSRFVPLLIDSKDRAWNRCCSLMENLEEESPIL